MRSRLAAYAGLALVASIALSGCGSDSDDTATDGSGTGVSCDWQQSGQAAKDVDPPADHATESGEVHAVIATSVGDIGATLDADAAPCTVSSFVSLADQHYFDDTSCHRLTTAGILVLQCGDPTGSGSGGPGYAFDDELDALPQPDSDGTIAYPAGTLAMANAGPDTNGSQFFIVYGDSRLPPAYTVFGTVDDAGLTLVKKVAAAGTDNANGPGDGHPTTAVDISAVTVG
ncbi:peptidylprolyl isomerase [Nocardioides mangrovi]|uniref:Peptidyl-prolyl cis-trans isomerase n=1 Tax=Nocardioides mangrovi TaxID=2874580 RepID=A0ABS7UDN1_9ACTN|nr:peptidylprolyl isomerase [Nocardioides mangrovi]MBZ5738959.1 peptidylprolyl isomerase [Nocardioides mangrovi]